jgi:cation diffusion facilitator family transporter
MSTAKDLRRFAWLSVAAAIATIALKMVAWALTGSVGLLSDALESFVNLAGAVFALWMLGVSRAPPDREHPIGHGKAEYFSAGFEGILILGAAVAIAVTAIDRLIHPRELEALGIGLGFSLAATAINFAVARVLLKVGHEHHSIALEGDGKHLMTDVWTSVGVFVGLGLVALTGFTWLDPVLALLVVANIVREAVGLMRRSADGLMDHALPEHELVVVEQVLAGFIDRGIQSTDLRTHRAGQLRFVTLEVLVPGEWTVQRGHDLVDELEAALRASLSGLTVVTHLAPIAIQPETTTPAQSAPASQVPTDGLQVSGGMSGSAASP